MTKKFFEHGYNTCEHRDENGNKEYTWYEHDARGLPLGGRMCHLCMDEVEADNRKRYREDVFTDSNYWHDEDLNEEAAVGREEHYQYLRDQQ